MAGNRKAARSVLWKRKPTMKRRFIVFSIILFLLIFIVGSTAYIFLMGQILHDNAEHELVKTVEVERHRLESSVNKDIAIVVKMATSPLIQYYFEYPDNTGIKILALKDIEGYRDIFTSGSLFWINNTNKEFHYDTNYAYTINPDDPSDYWYNLTLYATKRYNVNINYNPDLNVTNLWINAPVYDSDEKPLGILGTGMNLSDFVDSIYRNYEGTAQLYFFNAAGEITGARDIELVEKKVNITAALGQTGEEILNGMHDITASEIKFFETADRTAVAAIGSIPSLEWYAVAVHNFTVADSLQTSMTVLFGVMMAVILAVFAVFNIFIAKLLGPLYNIINKISQISSDWDLQLHSSIGQKDEIGALGEFLNLTIIDQLTGIYNRRFFDGNMKKTIKSLSRTEGKLSLLMIDIDFFKNYNDTYGHDMGDNCLKEVASALSESIIREEDFVARYGGEEFVVVLPNTDESGAYLIADRLLKRVRESNITHENSRVAGIVTISIGGTTGTVKYSQSGSDYVKRADTALYKSKHNGRNQYTFVPFDESPNP